MPQLLHLSDLHFGKEHFYDDNTSGRISLGSSVTMALRHENIIIDGMIISGDLFSTDQSEDGYVAEEGLQQLIENLNLNPNQVIAIPGNHECRWDVKIGKYAYKSYEQMCKALGIRYVSGGIAKVLPWPESNPVVVMIALDSCIAERQHHGLGMIGENQISDAELKINTLDQRYKSLPRIAVLHHHLLPINREILECTLPTKDDTQEQEAPVTLQAYAKEPVKIKIPSVTLDAPDLLRKFSELEISVVFHGHRHEPALLRYGNLWTSIQNEGRQERDLFIVAAGSAGDKKQEYRQFFVYEIETERLTVKSFQTEPQKGFFTRSKFEPLSIPLHRPGDPFKCGGNLKPIPQKRRIPFSKEDSSDLFYLLLNVRDCAESQTAIRDYFSGSIRYLEAWNHSNAKYIKLESMYSIMGRWDLLVKLRLDPAADATPFIEEIKSRLTESRLIDIEPSSNGGEKTENGFPQFSLDNVVNVTQEVPVSSEIIRLGTDQEYESMRCQRAFFFIKVPNGYHEKMINDLQTMLNSDKTPRQIIESYTISDDFLVIEVFMRCSQSIEINRLNRSLERWVPKYTKYGTQKYTLLCFTYDEKEFETKR